MTVPPSSACPLEQGGRPECHRCAFTGLCLCFNICPSRVTPDRWVRLDSTCKLSTIGSLPICCDNLPALIRGVSSTRAEARQADWYLSPRTGFPPLTGHAGEQRASQCGAGSVINNPRCVCYSQHVRSVPRRQ